MGRRRRARCGCGSDARLSSAESDQVSASPYWRHTLSFPNDPFASSDGAGARWGKFSILTSDPTQVYFQDSRHWARPVPTGFGRIARRTATAERSRWRCFPRVYSRFSRTSRSREGPENVAACSNTWCRGSASRFVVPIASCRPLRRRRRSCWSRPSRWSSPKPTERCSVDDAPSLPKSSRGYRSVGPTPARPSAVNDAPSSMCEANDNTTPSRS